MDSVGIDAELPLSTHPVTKNGAIVWPLAIDNRLDHLLGLVAQQHRTDRRELAAAIVFTASDDPERLGQILSDYRGARARDALLHLEPAREGAKIIHLPKHKPGPRSRVALEERRSV